MTSTRLKSDLGLCVICVDKKVAVSGRTENGRKLITNLLSCLSLVQLKSEGETLQNINFCLKCKQDLEKWTYAQGKAESVNFANRARQIQASLLVKILESTRKSSASSASSLVERIQRMIYDRFNVAVNLDRLELSQEPMDQIPKQEIVRPENHSSDYEESETSEVTDDLQDVSSSEESSSDVEISVDESDDEFIETLHKKPRISISTKIDYNNYGKCQLIDSRKSNVDCNLTQQARRTEEGAGPADVDPVERFQKDYPMPPDFIPKKYKPGSYLYGKCSVQEHDNKVKCCKCSLSIRMKTYGVSSRWKIREHIRNEHPELVPCLPPMRELVVQCINEDKFMYGQATMTKFLAEDGESYKCDACGESFRTKFARKHCMGHIVTHHPELTGSNRCYRETPVFVNEHRIRYAGAYLEKLTDTKVICLVCSFVSTGSLALTSSCIHVREYHPILAPLEISAILKTNSEAVQSSNRVKIDDSAPSTPVSSVSLTDQATEVQDDFEDASSTEESLSHVQISEAERNEEFVEVLPKKIRTSTSKNIDYKNGKCQLIGSQGSNVNYNLTTRAGLNDEETGPTDISDPVIRFQLSYPLPPDITPIKTQIGNYNYGKCSVKKYDNKVECCECFWSIPMQTDGVSSWWKIREHMRNEHPELVPCIPPVKELGLKCIGQDKFQNGQATMTKFLAEDRECYKCNACGESFRTKVAMKHCMGHILRRHPELTGFNGYYRETAVFVNRRRIRYAGAFLEKLTDTKVKCLVCSFVSTGSLALSSSCSHVREHHPALAPVEISAILQTNSGALQLSNTEMVDDSATSLTVSIDPVERFQLNHPLPPDIFPDKNRIGNYIYGKCSFKEYDNEVECCKCSLSIPMQIDGVSSWWKIREHMRSEHPELVPCIPPVKELTGFNGALHETAVFENQQRIRYAAAYLEKLSDTKVLCLVCSFVSTGSLALSSSCSHVRKYHPTLAPVEISAILQTNSEAVQSSTTVKIEDSATSLPASSVPLTNQDEILVKREDKELLEVQSVEQTGQEDMDAVEDYQLMILSEPEDEEEFAVNVDRRPTGTVSGTSIPDFLAGISQTWKPLK